MSEEKCAIALKVSLGLSAGECESFEDFIQHFGRHVFGLTDVPTKRDCRRVLLKHVSKRNYQDVLRYVLCCVLRELEAGKNFDDAIQIAWSEVKQKTGE